MAKFINTTEISYQIEKLINEANKFIVLLSPYVSIHSRLRNVITAKLKKRNISFFIVCRIRDLKGGDSQWLKENERIKVIDCPNLHAKCYANEGTALVTSMNLYEYSAVNNIEFGFLVHMDEDIKNYFSILREIEQLISIDLGSKYEAIIEIGLNPVI